MRKVNILIPKWRYLSKWSNYRVWDKILKAAPSGYWEQWLKEPKLLSSAANNCLYSCKM
jgi:hypothetical protein